MLSNYNVKRMLPRLVIAVILVNVSYYICLVAVDISNILGYGINALFDQILAVQGGGENGTWEEIMAVQLAAGLAGTAAVAAIALTFSMPAVILSLLALLLIAFILIARQALIILLIVLAPLAFVAYLLPNTDNLYKKWQKMFLVLLMVFPVVGLVFGASTLASKIMLQVDNGEPGVYSVMALAVLAIPLFAVPAILKSAMSISGSVGARLAGMQDRTTGAIRRSGKESAAARRKYGSNFLKTKAYSATGSDKSGALLGEGDTRRRKFFRRGVDATIGRGKKRDETYKAAEIAKNASERSYYTDKVLNQAGYAESVASGDSDMAGLIKGYAQEEARSEDMKDTNAEKKLLERVSLYDIKNNQGEVIKEGLVSIMKSSKGSRAAAAAALIGESGDGNAQILALDSLKDIDTSHDNGKTSFMVQEQFINNMKGDLAGLSHTDKGNLRRGEYDASKDYDTRVDERTQKKMSGEKLVSTQPHDIARMEKLANNGSYSDTSLANLVNAIQEARSNPTLSGKITLEQSTAHEQVLDEAIRRGVPGAQEIKDGPVVSVVNSPATELRIDHSQPATTSVSTPQATATPQPTAPTTTSSPQSTRTSAPPISSGYQQRPSGLYVPPTAGESPNPPAQPPNSL